MTDAEKYYEVYGGCSCHTCPPCSFCLMITEEEVNVLNGGDYIALEKFWRQRALEPEWAVIFNYDNGLNSEFFRLT